MALWPSLRPYELSAGRSTHRTRKKSTGERVEHTPLVCHVVYGTRIALLRAQALSLPPMSAGDVVSDAAHTLLPTPEELEAQGRAETNSLPKENDLLHNLPKAMAQLQQPLVDLHDIPILRLAAIRITGLKDTRNGFLAGMCRPYVDPTAPEAFLSDLRYGHRMYFPLPGQPTTIHAILQSATSFSADISRMDLAKDISVELEPSTVSDRHPHEDVDVVLRIRPASRFFLKTSTSVGNSEGTASVQGKIRNLFGGAESLEGSATLGTRTKHNYNVSYFLHDGSPYIRSRLLLLSSPAPTCGPMSPLCHNIVT